MGWENAFHCEWNPFGQKVLHYYWPEAEQFTDITKSDFTKYANRIDILTGGFPCQPYSTAGKRLGKEDERHLWPEMLRAIREIQPTWIVGENVFGLINWNGGMVFDEVQADLEAQGYEVQPYVLPACAVNAPHRRDRVWFVAHSSGKRLERCASKRIQTNERRADGFYDGITSWSCNDGVITNANSDGISRQSTNARTSKTNGQGRQGFKKIRNIRYVGRWESFPTQSPICDGNDGLPKQLDGITFSKWRNESIKAGGNAIVPQVALQIFKAIEQYEKQLIS